MIKIVGIGGCGDNILAFIEKQNLQDKKSDYEFMSIKNEDDIKNINFSSDDTIFTISGLGGNTAGNLTILLSKKIIDNNLKVKNIIVLPFSMEFTTKKAIQELDELISVNQNIKIFANDDISNENNKDKTMSELMREYDSNIFNEIIRENQRELKSFIVAIQKDDKTYKAIVNFWSKDIHTTLLEPNFKLIDNTHMSYGIPSAFVFKNGDKSIKGVDVEETANNILNAYIDKQKS